MMVVDVGGWRAGWFTAVPIDEPGDNGRRHSHPVVVSRRRHDVAVPHCSGRRLIRDRRELDVLLQLVVVG